MFISSCIRTVFPTPAPPNRPILPPFKYGTNKSTTFIPVSSISAVDTGRTISVPVGDATLGRIFNVLGEPVDDAPAPKDAPQLPIHSQTSATIS